ncbi:hypothetical protein, partial [Vibrio lentus]
NNASYDFRSHRHKPVSTFVDFSANGLVRICHSLIHLPYQYGDTTMNLTYESNFQTVGAKKIIARKNQVNIFALISRVSSSQVGFGTDRKNELNSLFWLGLIRS